MLHPPVSPGAVRRAGWLLLCLIASVGVSCSSANKEDRKPVFSVTGRVFVGEKPAAGAFVVLIPENEAAAKHPRPHATVEKDGSFTLRTYGDKDGAPAGKYTVTVWWPQMVDGREEGDRLQGRYSEGKSKLPATVKEEPNELPSFKLK